MREPWRVVEDKFKDRATLDAWKAGKLALGAEMLVDNVMMLENVIVAMRNDNRRVRDNGFSLFGYYVTKQSIVDVLFRRVKDK